VIGRGGFSLKKVKDGKVAESDWRQ